MRLERSLENCGQNFHGAALTIGNYDGLHLGHQSLMSHLQTLGGPRVVVTFDPHPIQVLYPDRQLCRLFPREDLQEQLPRLGVDLLLILPFDASFAKLTAEEFLSHWLLPAFRPRKFVVGYDFAFGQGRQGTIEVLRRWAAARQVAVEVVSPLELDGETVSSRRIRELILDGDVARACRWLGRPYYLRGLVVPGAGRGSQLGIPTLNQSVVNETLPKGGVYASRVRWSGQTLASVTNIGTNPTFENQATMKIETHILDGQHALRNQVVDVDLVERLRDEKKFSGIEDLKKQIQSDILKARSILRT